MNSKNESEVVSKYLQGLLPLKLEYVQMVKTIDIPTPNSDYKVPVTFENLTSDFPSAFPVARLLTKAELVAEDEYLKNLREWIKKTLNATEERHKKELDILQTQLQQLVIAIPEPKVNRFRENPKRNFENKILQI